MLIRGARHRDLALRQVCFIAHETLEQRPAVSVCGCRPGDFSRRDYAGSGGHARSLQAGNAGKGSAESGRDGQGG